MYLLCFYSINCNINEGPLGKRYLLKGHSPKIENENDMKIMFGMVDGTNKN